MQPGGGYGRERSGDVEVRATSRTARGKTGVRVDFLLNVMQKMGSGSLMSA